ncbi:MAG: PTS sugar transporter subunit IIB [Lachnospiraceae bacterium]|nr:PTS sugar transporter subunit IIB [Lachnospiraceae bacterium]
MKLLLLCAGGASTGVLVQKLLRYAESNNINLTVEAHSVSSVEELAGHFDIIMLGPQVSYKKDEVLNNANLPVGIISPMDYALGNAENIIKQVQGILKEGA